MTIQEQAASARVGVFSSVEQADRVVGELLAAGFPKNRISVICSDHVTEELFAPYRHPPLPKEHLSQAVAGGASIGAIALGGAAAIVGVTTAGVGLAVVGPILLGLGGGAVVGGLVGGMMTRGFTREMADYYDQAVTQGKILVAVEDESRASQRRLAEAENIFHRNGAEPVPLE
jgi:hypothetical protein